MPDPIERMYERAIATAPADEAERLREYLHTYRTEIKGRPEPTYSCADEPPISVEALGDWLVDKGLADASAGFGHASGEQVAAELLAHFTITPRKDIP